MLIFSYLLFHVLRHHLNIQWHLFFLITILHFILVFIFVVLRFFCNWLFFWFVIFNLGWYIFSPMTTNFYICYQNLYSQLCVYSIEWSSYRLIREFFYPRQYCWNLLALIYLYCRIIFQSVNHWEVGT